MSIEYSKLFQHVESLPITTLCTTGRTGSDFFQSLIDGHQQVLQLPSNWVFYDFWDQALCKGDIDDLVEEFIWYKAEKAKGYIHFFKFKSKYHVFEGLDQLGDNKDQSISVSLDLFKMHMRTIFKDKEINSRNFFLAIHISYALASNEEILNKKLLFFHIHHIHRLKRFGMDFPNFTNISSVRDPRNTFVSGIEHWKKFDPDFYSSGHCLFMIKRLYNESMPVYEITNKAFNMRLEGLVANPRNMMEKFCKVFGLEFDECMMKSTMMKMQWWGDKLSPKQSNTFRKDVVVNKWAGKFFFYEIFITEFLLRDRFEEYNYPFFTKKWWWVLVPLLPVLILLPYKYDIKILFFHLLSKNSLIKKAKYIYTFFSIYRQRVSFFIFFFRKYKMKKSLYVIPLLEKA